MWVIGRGYWEEVTGHYLLLKYYLKDWMPKYLDLFPPHPLLGSKGEKATTS